MVFAPVRSRMMTAGGGLVRICMSELIKEFAKYLFTISPIKLLSTYIGRRFFSAETFYDGL